MRVSECSLRPRERVRAEAQAELALVIASISGLSACGGSLGVISGGTAVLRSVYESGAW